MVEGVMRLPVPPDRVPTTCVGSGGARRTRQEGQRRAHKERCFMAQLQIVYLLRSGTQERWRRLCQEVAGSRKEQFESSCRHMGITRVQVRLVQMLHSDLMLMTLHTQEPHQTLKTLVSSKRPFDRWLRAQLQVLLGWNVQDVLNGLPDPQGDLIFTWGP